MGTKFYVGVILVLLSGIVSFVNYSVIEFVILIEFVISIVGWILILIDLFS